MDIAFLADALATRLCEATGSNPYVYGPAGPPYSDFNIEQQAQIVEDWFAGNDPVTKQQNRPQMDESSPYFRYIEDNVRRGEYGF